MKVRNKVIMSFCSYFTLTLKYEQFKIPECLTKNTGSFFIPLHQPSCFKTSHESHGVQNKKTLVVELKHGSEHDRLELGRMFKEANLG